MEGFGFEGRAGDGRSVCIRGDIPIYRWCDACLQGYGDDYKVKINWGLAEMLNPINEKRGAMAPLFSFIGTTKCLYELLAQSPNEERHEDQDSNRSYHFDLKL